MCGIAISQILRKATGSKREYCLSILFEATERADNSNALIELTGKISHRILNIIRSPKLHFNEIAS